jgi:hypothetical protein
MSKFYFQQNNNLIEVRFSTDVSVNAWEGSVILSPAPPDAKIITAESITTFWQTPPALEGNKIFFRGGRPNGFEGEGTLFKISLPAGKYSLEFSPNSAAYLNDGLGTAALIELQPRTFSVAAKEELVDRTPPQPFRPFLYRDKNFFDGRPVVIFETMDLESGVSRYEIRETTRFGVGSFHQAESPYFVNPDVKKLEIKAIDAFGNERIEVLRVAPEFSLTTLVIASAIFVVILGLLYNLIIRRQKARNYEH